MKPIHSVELSEVLKDAQSLIGARLQELHLEKDQMGIGFWKQGRLHWLWMDLRPPTLAVFVTEDKPVKTKSLVKPVLLFIRAHLRDKKLKTLTHEKDFGRVFRLHFSGVETPVIEVHVLPGGRNVIVHAGEKSISLHPVEELTLVSDSHRPERIRSPEEIYQEWLESQSRGGVQGNKINAGSADKIEKRKIKIQSAIDKLQAEILSDPSKPWRELGEWLKTNGTLDVPVDWKEMVDGKKSLAANIQNVFQAAKELERKRNAQLAQVEKLKADLEKLNSAGSADEARKGSGSKAEASKKLDVSVKARFLDLPKGMRIYVGRSAKENMELLRQAQAWDLWMHLRDYPSSHGLLRLTRGQSATQEVLSEAAHFLVEVSFAAKAKLQKGNDFEIVVCEKRFVRPIPGDKIGRVQYQNAKNFRIRF